MVTGIWTPSAVTGNVLYPDFEGGCNDVALTTIPYNNLYVQLSLLVLYLTVKHFLTSFIEGSDADRGFFNVILQRVDE